MTVSAQLRARAGLLAVSAIGAMPRLTSVEMLTPTSWTPTKYSAW